MHEQVLVVSTDTFKRNCYFEGLDPIRRVYQLGQTLFIDRAYAEKSTVYKQLIPYSILMHDKKVLCYTRSTASGEKRLHHKVSIGIGGHINPNDCMHFPATIIWLCAFAAQREIKEETGIHVYQHQLEEYSLLYSPSSAVSQVHIGVVFFVHLDESNHVNKFLPEKTMTTYEWCTIKQLRSKYKDMEIWSQLCYEQLKL